MAEVYFHCSSAQGLFRDRRSMRAVVAIEAPAIKLSGWLRGWSGPRCAPRGVSGGVDRSMMVRAPARPV
jgi:hypothetical protein